MFAQSPHGKNFDIDCSMCHQSDSWKINLSKVSFDHSKTKFNLIGQHQNVDCKSCHTTLVFSEANNDCKSCHKDIHQGTVGFDCANCHSPSSWIVKDIVGVHQAGRFPLMGAHKLADCAQCHHSYPELKFDVLNVDCYACHANDYNFAKTPNHLTANFSKDCQECHSISSLTWSASNVNHSFFPLVGGHALPSCYSCHKQNTFQGLTPDCYSCHRPNYEATKNPNHISAGLPTTCNVCHSISGWSPANFNHNITQFPLTGKHVNVNCADCHKTGYTGTPTDCYSCHQQNYQSTTDPNHVQQNYPKDCTACHNTTGWDGATFNHGTSSFPLTGKHTSVNCADCHKIGYTGTPTDCFSCHQQNYQSTTDPNHIQQNYPTDCTACHNTTGWDGATFNHSTNSFPLTGKHTSVTCTDCHKTGYTGTPTDCYSCHQSDYQSVSNPNHVQQNYPKDCTACHNTTGWSGATFNHGTSSFPLTGKHTSVTCADCHKTGYTGTPTDCYSCHQPDYQSVSNPNHVQQNYPKDCTACHNTTGWSSATFDHNTSSFPLTGKHTSVTCADCHKTGYTGTPTDCYSCHQSDYQSVSNPNHVQQNYPKDCTACHNTAGWSGATFDHSQSGFPLTGSHVQVSCANCHASGYSGISTDCVSCHQTNFQQAANPNHVALSIPTNCESCHTTNPGWTPATFPIHNNIFPLVGAHSLIKNCDDCHKGNYNSTPKLCYDCHASDFNSTNDPPHQSQNISHDCLQCHNMNSWAGATFNHSFFPISSKHSNVSCNECHSQTGYKPQCLSCHQNDFLDKHKQGDRTDCWSCHSTSKWD